MHGVEREVCGGTYIMEKRTLENLIKILKYLEETRDTGSWLTEIGKRTKIHRTTVGRLIDRYLSEFVTQDIVPPFNLRTVKLKPDKDLKGILRYLAVKQKIEAVRKAK